MNKIYITTPIYYVNAEPHIGFGMELVTADVLAGIEVPVVAAHQRLG